MWNQEEFNRFIIELGIVGFLETPEITDEGERHWYFDWAKATDDVWGTVELTQHILDFMTNHDLTSRCVYGLTQQAAKIAPRIIVELAQHDNSYGPGSHPILMPDSIPVKRRMQDQLNGDPIQLSKTPVGETLILDEATGTGERITRTVDDLIRRGRTYIVGVIGFINFEQTRTDGKTVEQAIAERGIKYFAMSKMQTLMSMAYERTRPADTIARKVEQDFRRYGIEVKLL